VFGYGETKDLSVVVRRDGTGAATLRCEGHVAGRPAAVDVTGTQLHAESRGAGGLEAWAMQGARASSADGLGTNRVLRVTLTLPRACDSIGGAGYLSVG